MNAYQRIALITDIMAKVEAETETLRTEDHLGADLAYLFAAIADLHPPAHVLWEGDGLHAVTLHLFIDWFAPNHAVWQFIRVTK